MKRHIWKQCKIEGADEVAREIMRKAKLADARARLKGQAIAYYQTSTMEFDILGRDAIMAKQMIKVIYKSAGCPIPDNEWEALWQKVKILKKQHHRISDIRSNLSHMVRRNERLYPLSRGEYERYFVTHPNILSKLPGAIVFSRARGAEGFNFRKTQTTIEEKELHGR
jgi:hypothetical protein